jgi:hypothetical protein
VQHRAVLDIAAAADGDLLSDHGVSSKSSMQKVNRPLNGA